MAESLVDRITYRLKFVNGIDRRLLVEARAALMAGGTDRGRGFFVPQEDGETRADAIKRICGQGLLPWAKDRLEEADL